MVANAQKTDGVSLLQNDVMAKISGASAGEDTLNFSGAIDILGQIRNREKNQHITLHIDAEPFMVEFFEKVVG
jgi:hypothetical protein